MGDIEYLGPLGSKPEDEPIEYIGPLQDKTTLQSLDGGVIPEFSTEKVIPTKPQQGISNIPEQPSKFGQFLQNPGFDTLFGILPDESPEKLRAKAINSLALSEQLGISPSQAFDHHDELVKELGLRGVLTTSEYLMATSMPIMAMGFAQAPGIALLGLAGYQSLAEVESAFVNYKKGTEYHFLENRGIQELAPETTSQRSKDFIELLSVAGKGLITGAGLKGSPKLVEKLTRETIVKYNLPETVYIDPKDLRTELQRPGSTIPATEMDIIQSLGLSGSEYRSALRDGLRIEIPAEKITTIQDRPWFSKLKEIFRLESDTSVSREFAKNPSQNKVSGLIEDGLNSGLSIESTSSRVKKISDPFDSYFEEIVSGSRDVDSLLSDNNKSYVKHDIRIDETSPDRFLDLSGGRQPLYPGEDMFRSYSSTSEPNGFIWLKDEGDGFSVRRIETKDSSRGQGVAEQLFLAASEKYGPFKGATDYTKDGEKFFDRLFLKYPEKFALPEGYEKFNAREIINNQTGVIDIDKFVELGQRVWNEGRTTYADFVDRIKQIFGDLWIKVKDSVRDIWNHLKEFNESIGQEGSIGSRSSSKTDYDAKARIRELTGQRKNDIKVSESEALSASFKKAEQHSKKAFKAGVEEGKLQASLEPEKTMKGHIRDFAGITKVSDLVTEREALYASMKKAEQASRIAFREGKIEALAEQKEKMKQLLGERKIKSAILEDASNMIKDIKSAAKSIKKMDPDVADNVQQLVSDLDFSKMTENKRASLTPLRDYLRDNPETQLPDRVMKELDRLDKTPIRDLTLDQLEQIHIAVMHYVKLNDNLNTLRVGAKQMEREQVLKASIDEMKPVSDVVKDTIGSISELKMKKIRTTQILKSTFGIRQDHYDLIIEKLAGPNSTMDKILYQAIKKGTIARLKYRQDTFDQFQSDLGPNFMEKHKIKSLDSWINEKVTTGKYELTRGERMALYRHSMNRQNFMHVIRGGIGFRYSSDPNKVFKITSDEVFEILDSLSPAEIEFSEKPVDNLFINQGQKLAEVFLEKNGYKFPMVENYYPLDVMPLERGAQDLETMDTLESLKDQFMRVGLDKGMLEERKSSGSGIYLNSITYDINKSVERASSYIGLELPLSNASRLLYDKTFRKELESRYGKEVYHEIESGLKDVANNWKSFTEVEKGALKLKNRLTTAFLGLPNPFPMMAQLAGLPMYQTYVQPKYILQGAIDVALNHKSVMDRHNLMSPEFRDRVDSGFNWDIADVLKSQAEFRIVGGKNDIRSKLLAGQRFIDKETVAMGMQGAVLQVLDEIKAGKLSRDVSVALDNPDISSLSADNKIRLAYKYADYATERTQATNMPENQSSFSKGSVFERFLSIFGSDTNAQLNLLRRGFDTAKRTKEYGPLAKAIWLTMFVVPVYMMGRDYLRDFMYGRDSKEPVGQYIQNVSSMLFIVRDITNASIELYERGDMAGDVKNPVTAFPTSIAKTLGHGASLMAASSNTEKDKEFKAMVDNGLLSMSYYYGIPYASTKKLVEASLGVNKPKKRKKRR